MDSYTMVHTIADASVFVFSCPKEGCDILTYDINTLVKSDDTGHLSLSDNELANLIVYKRTLQRHVRQ